MSPGLSPCNPNAPQLNSTLAEQNINQRIKQVMLNIIPELEGLELGKWIWKNLVPKSGQSQYVQGELLRANEKLRDEAIRNGNGNWDSGFEILIDYLEKTLCLRKRIFYDPCKILRNDIIRLRNYKDPYLDDDLYDRIASEIFKYCKKNRTLIPREHNKSLNR